MLVTVNGEYTKEFMIAFTKSYMSDWETFCDFCERHHLNNDEVITLTNYIISAGSKIDTELY